MHWFLFHSWELTSDDSSGPSIALQFKSSPRQYCPTMSFGIPTNLFSAIIGQRSVLSRIKPSENCILYVKITDSRLQILYDTRQVVYTEFRHSPVILAMWHYKNNNEFRNVGNQLFNEVGNTRLNVLFCDSTPQIQIQIKSMGLYKSLLDCLQIALCTVSVCIRIAFVG